MTLHIGLSHSFNLWTKETLDFVTEITSIAVDETYISAPYRLTEPVLRVSQQDDLLRHHHVEEVNVLGFEADHFQIEVVFAEGYVEWLREEHPDSYELTGEFYEEHHIIIESEILGNLNLAEWYFHLRLCLPVRDNGDHLLVESFPRETFRLSDFQEF